ncbi:hypothetical protein LIA77_02703 [Sarocladium implicatum]|nr:hypothetical protein LIA77_02703 [Sarocladium implicatum]
MPNGFPVLLRRFHRRNKTTFSTEKAANTVAFARNCDTAFGADPTTQALRTIKRGLTHVFLRLRTTWFCMKCIEGFKRMLLQGDAWRISVPAVVAVGALSLESVCVRSEEDCLKPASLLRMFSSNKVSVGDETQSSDRLTIW